MAVATELPSEATGRRRGARASALIAGVWAGVLLCIALVATPAAFAVLAPADAGRVAGHIFAREAVASLVVALLLLAVRRRAQRDRPIGGAGSVVDAEVLLLLGTVFCTVGGYYAVQPMMAAARAGAGALSFGALHAVSFGAFAVKGVFVLALAWRLGR